MSQQPRNSSLGKIVSEQLHPLIQCHQAVCSSVPFIVAISGPQGSGKTTLASSLSKILQSQGYGVVKVSIDDFYFPHAELVRIREANPKNLLLKTRGQPGTHDAELAHNFFLSLSNRTEDIFIPCFDKSKFNGEGDRVDPELWEKVPRDRQVDVVIFEGWCIGFTPLSEEEIAKKWIHAKVEEPDSNPLSSENGRPVNTLPRHRLADLLRINENLGKYVTKFMSRDHFDCLVHLDAVDISQVYNWRLEAERNQIAKTGSGMTNDEVVRFVAGYLPGYELYTKQLRELPFFGTDSTKLHLQIVLDNERAVVEIKELVGIAPTINE